jgi:superoxide reductase
MATNLEIYRCDVCGTMTEVLQGGQGALFCCSEPMKRLEKNTVDASREKHVPVIERGDGVITVRVGSVPHPMEDKHIIAWIEVIAEGMVHRQFLRPGDAPEATFAITADAIIAREYCTLHGLWSVAG